MLCKKRDEWAQSLAGYDVINGLADGVLARPASREVYEDVTLGE